MWTKFGVVELIPLLQGDTGCLGNDHHGRHHQSRVYLHLLWLAHWLGCLPEGMLYELLLASMVLSCAAAYWLARTWSWAALCLFAVFFQASVIFNQPTSEISLAFRNRSMGLGPFLKQPWVMYLGLDPSACLRLNCVSQSQHKTWLPLGCKEWLLPCDRCVCLHQALVPI